MASHPGPEAAKQPWTITLSPPCLTVGMCSFYEIMWCFMPAVMGHRSYTMFNFCCISPQNICPKVLGIIKIVFGKCETSLCVLAGQQWLLPQNSPMDAVFAQFLTYCWIMNTDLNWGKWGLQFFKSSGFFNYLLDESSLRSWSNSPFVDYGFDRGLLSYWLSLFICVKLKDSDLCHVVEQAPSSCQWQLSRLSPQITSSPCKWMGSCRL